MRYVVNNKTPKSCFSFSCISKHKIHEINFVEKPSQNVILCFLERHVATVQFSFDADYHVVVRDDATKQSLMNVIEDKLADTMKVDRSMILNVTIAPGSIVVNFVLLAPEDSKLKELDYLIMNMSDLISNACFPWQKSSLHLLNIVVFY